MTPRRQAQLDFARIALAEDHAALDAAMHGDGDLAECVRLRALMMDHILKRLWGEFISQPRELSLLAIGGYGRGELAPRSDIDLLVLSETRAVDSGLEELVAQLWDLGLQPSLSVRSPRECQSDALGDIHLMTALLEARLLAGAAEPMAEMKKLINAPHVWPSDRFFRAKREEQDKRHSKYFDTAHNLEPNLKEGIGGLRDLHTILWVAKRHYRVETWEDLLKAHFLIPSEYEAIIKAERHLWALRAALHGIAGKREERLLFDFQKPLAELFGFRDEHANNLAVEQFMQRYFITATRVDRLNGRLLQAFEEDILAPLDPTPVLPLNEDFQVRGGYLEARSPNLFARKPWALIEAFLLFKTRPGLSGIRASTERLMRSHLKLLNDSVRALPDAKRAFLEIFADGHGLENVLQRMNRLGVLAQYVPAFAHVVGRMQYDLFHAYTVDQHTVFVLSRMARYSDPNDESVPKLAAEVYKLVRRPLLLFLAGLFHDIAKGRGGDHSQLGELDARAFGHAHDLPQTDTELIAWLVRQHLLMSVTAQRQDLSDPAVILKFAREVGDWERLNYLYLLTVADISATSPKLWNSWKDRLLAELYEKTRLALRARLVDLQPTAQRIADARAEAMTPLLQMMPKARIEQLWADFPDESFIRYSVDQLVWQTEVINLAGSDEILVALREDQRFGTSELFVHTPDRDGLFAAIAITLDRLAFNIVEARVVTARSGYSLDTFRILDGNQALSAERAERLVSMLKTELKRLPKLPKPVKRAEPRSAKHFAVAARIGVRKLNPKRTQIEVICRDRIGLLAQIALEFSALKLRVHEARVATFGERVEDFFVLSDQHDHALSEALVAQLETALQTEIAPR